MHPGNRTDAFKRYKNQMGDKTKRLEASPSNKYVNKLKMTVKTVEVSRFTLFYSPLIGNVPKWLDTL